MERIIIVPCKSKVNPKNMEKVSKIATLAAICKMSGCITTDILPPLYSELVGGGT